MGRYDALTRNFDFKEEEIIYNNWEDSGAFIPKSSEKKFFLPMPPPNITGHLHAGHAYFSTIQDTITRYKRMQGHQTLWLPGTDHAGLATDKKIMSNLAKKGIKSPSKDQYDQEAESWKGNTSHHIAMQIRKMGAGCDWSRERYTLDQDYTKATIEAFNRLNEKGLIFRKDNQWYLDTSDLAKDLLNKLDNKEIKIIPAYEEKTLREFLNKIEPWCLSRQIRWGHRIPAWFNDDKFIIARDENQAKNILGENIIQDNDVLDTWFSSSLWPFATLGWPSETEDFKKFYPADLIETGADILFFWCARMLMMGLALTDQLPFKTIYLHGMIRDKNGDKMSKSLNNGIDPLDIIARFGTDGMRFSMLQNTTPGQDFPLNDEAFSASKKFANKIWQASRFALSHYERKNYPHDALITHQDDLKIIELSQKAKNEIKIAFENYDFREASNCFRAFFKDQFCDWYIESAKERLYSDDDGARKTILDTLDLSLRMLHPMMPFISEKIRSSYSSKMLINDSF